MDFIRVVALPFFIFVTLIIFLRYILTRNITSATGHLQELSKEYAAKQEEINKLLEESKEEARIIIAEAKREAEDLKDKSVREGYDKKEGIIKEAHEKAEKMIAQAERACEVLKTEEEDKIEQRALNRAKELIKGALPEKFLQEVQALWMEESRKSEFNLGRINLPDNIKEVKITSAFSLTSLQRSELHDKLKKKIGQDINITEEVDPGLIAGFKISAGSVVIDVSVQNEIQKAIKRI